MAQWPTYHADIILNQNISANPLMYPCSGEVRLLLGTNYVLLRREFLSWQVERAFPKIARRVLVTLGGSDPDNRTLKIIRALEKVSVPGLEAKIVVGSANPNLDSLRQASGGKGPEILTGVANMPELMAWADVAVTAGGSTCWESAFMGLPSLILIMSENQRANAEGLARSGIAINLGWFNEVSVDQVVHALTLLMKSQEARERMSALGQQLVDGLGASRALAALQAPISRVVKA
jgi:spore coat polysaccharide biosynthesis predicted glycosyltransferase SpsG